MTESVTFLNHRAILEITGEDRITFLQGLVTNDVKKVEKGELVYAAMLSAQGRFLYDFFLFENDDKRLFVDCDAARRDEILKKLNFYKLRAKVEIKKNDELVVAQVFSNKNPKDFPKFSADPRNPELGLRAYTTKDTIDVSPTPKTPIEEYHFRRISLKIPEGELDLTYEKSFILEFDFDNLNAIDYQKGCYVGQELTARTHYRGEIRKKLFHLEIPQQNVIEKGQEISYQQNKVGEVLSSVFYQNKLHALALIKDWEAISDLSQLTFE